MRNTYENPLCVRYASETMKYIFSDDNKFSNWRKLWIALAKAEKELGIDITDAQISQMENAVNDIDYEKAAEYERQLRHDVMAHVHTFGDRCPDARPIIHLGATSCYVGDNTDIIVMRQGLLQIRKLLLNTIQATAAFAEKWKSTPTLAYTHFQAAQPTTAGKRATLWLQDLLMDLPGRGRPSRILVSAWNGHVQLYIPMRLPKAQNGQRCHCIETQSSS